MRFLASIGITLVLSPLWLVGPMSARESPGEQGRCEIATALGAVRERQTVLLVEPLADSALVSLHHFDWYDWGGEFSGQPAPSDSTWGRVFRVLAVSQGTDGPTVLRADEIVVVPWEYDGGCTPTPWMGGLSEWAGPGLEVFRGFYARRHAGAERTVLDVMGWHDPYPSADFLSGSARPPPEEWLPAEVYFDLLTALPRRPASASRYDAFTAALDSAATAWLEAHPQHADRFPATLFHDRTRPGR